VPAPLAGRSRSSLTLSIAAACPPIFPDGRSGRKDRSGPGAFQVATAAIKDEEKIERAFQSGDGVGWHEHHHDLLAGTERFFRPGYAANLISSWIRALEGVQAKLERGARVADVGCGHGASTILMAQAFPNSEFIGFDCHDASIEHARQAALDDGLDSRVRFEVASAKQHQGGPYELVAMFDCLHDMGDPVGAAAHVLDTLAPDGTWLIVEPYAGDRLQDNLGPVGRVYYGASTLICTPTSRDQEVGLALGAQAGEARLREVVTAGGFTRFRRATETPFNLVLEARPESGHHPKPDVHRALACWDANAEATARARPARFRRRADG
jgi:SAM-dependent methyltransferase